MRTLAAALAAAALAGPALAGEYTVLAFSKGPDAGMVLVEDASIDRSTSWPNAWFLSIFDRADDGAAVAATVHRAAGAGAVDRAGIAVTTGCCGGGAVPPTELRSACEGPYFCDCDGMACRLLCGGSAKLPTM